MKSKLLESVCLAALLASPVMAMAAKPAAVGQAHQSQATAQARLEIQIGRHFRDEQRQAARHYYGKQQAKGRCPPGLAKKNNGCRPPGLAKQWSLGQPLPAALTWYDVPRGVVLQIGLPPDGHKYVRVFNDLLLVTLGSMMVVDAIEDLMRQ